MMPFRMNRWRRVSRRTVILGLGSILGCSTSAIRLQSPEAEQLSEVENRIKTVGEYTIPMGLKHIKVESVALVTGLDETGSDPPPSSRRGVLIREMQTYDVENPNSVLVSPNTSLVIVRAYLPPGIKKGDRFDLEVRVPTKSDTTSLRGGWLMETRLKELAALGNRIHQGHILARAEGPILINSLVKGGDDPINEVRGRVLGGGISLTSRDLRLVVRTEQVSVRVTTLIGAAINKRFHGYDRGTKKGMAKPKTDKYLELHLHPRYEQNITRYVRVIQAIPLRLSAAEQIVYLQLLERQLLDSATSEAAAVRLEAIGREAVSALSQGLDSENPEVQFHAAEALAYMDDGRAAEVLATVATRRPALRRRALKALSAMDDIAAYDKLNDLLHVSSAETRYGAFRALRLRNAEDPLISRQEMGGEFDYHVVGTTGESMVHISHRDRPEIVAFGNDIEFKVPLVAFAGKRLMVDGRLGEGVKVIRFDAADDEFEHCSAKLGDVLGTIIRLGGTYPEVVQFLQNAKAGKYLDARLVVDSLPRHVRGQRARKYETADSSQDSDSRQANRGSAKTLPTADASPEVPPRAPASADLDTIDSPRGKDDSSSDLLHDAHDDDGGVRQPF